MRSYHNIVGHKFFKLRSSLLDTNNGIGLSTGRRMK
jgi:hypothetical protein